MKYTLATKKKKPSLDWLTK